jgi:hypothetical protein
MLQVTYKDPQTGMVMPRRWGSGLESANRRQQRLGNETPPLLWSFVVETMKENRKLRMQAIEDRQAMTAVRRRSDGCVEEF